MKLFSVLLSTLLGAVAVYPQDSPKSSTVVSRNTTDVMAILTVKQGVSRDQVMKVLPGEVRDTVKLYLDGKIRQWYSRSDGRGVVFILNANSVDSARALMESLPLAKEHLMDYEYIPLSPLAPLASLIANQQSTK